MADGRLVSVRRTHARSAVIERGSASDPFTLSFKSTNDSHPVVGDEAMRIAARLMPTVNRFGGSSTQVAEAVDVLEEVGDPVQLMRTLQQRFGGSSQSNRAVSRWKRASSEAKTHERGTLKSLAPRDRLALGNGAA